MMVVFTFNENFAFRSVVVAGRRWVVVIVFELSVTISTNAGNVDVAFLVNSVQHFECESCVLEHRSCGKHWLEMAVAICKIIQSVFSETIIG